MRFGQIHLYRAIPLFLLVLVLVGCASSTQTAGAALETSIVPAQLESQTAIVPTQLESQTATVPAPIESQTAVVTATAMEPDETATAMELDETATALDEPDATVTAVEPLTGTILQTTRRSGQSRRYF